MTRSVRRATIIAASIAASVGLAVVATPLAAVVAAGPRSVAIVSAPRAGIGQVVGQLAAGRAGIERASAETASAVQASAERASAVEASAVEASAVEASAVEASAGGATAKGTGDAKAASGSFTPVKYTKKVRKTSKTTSRPKAPAAVASTPLAGTATAYATAQNQVIALTNKYRLANGCRALRTDSRLTTAARAHSTDMVTKNFFSHTSSDGSTFSTRASRAGYAGASGENIAWGWPTPQRVVDAWINSAGHRANILNCSSVAVGVGLVKKADGTPYWTQVFGRS